MTKAKVGERLPLLAKLWAPRVLERLEQTAALAREQEWPYERLLETLLEAEVFATDAFGAPMRIRTNDSTRAVSSPTTIADDTQRSVTDPRPPKPTCSVLRLGLFRTEDGDPRLCRSTRGSVTRTDEVRMPVLR